MVITLIDTCVMTNSFHKQFYHNVNKGMLTKYNGLAQLLYDICLDEMAKCFYINTVPLGEKKKKEKTTTHSRNGENKISPPTTHVHLGTFSGYGCNFHNSF